MPKLFIHRISEFENRARKIKIELDGKLVAKIKNGEKLELEVQNVLDLEVDSYSKIKVELSSGDGSSLYRAFFRAKEYLKLTNSHL